MRTHRSETFWLKVILLIGIPTSLISLLFWYSSYSYKEANMIKASCYDSFSPYFIKNYKMSPSEAISRLPSNLEVQLELNTENNFIIHGNFKTLHKTECKVTVSNGLLNNIDVCIYQYRLPSRRFCEHKEINH